MKLSELSDTARHAVAIELLSDAYKWILRRVSEEKLTHKDIWEHPIPVMRSFLMESGTDVKSIEAEAKQLEAQR